MDPITIAMLGLTAVNMLQNQQNAKDSKAQREAAIRYSPWNKVPVNDYEPANPWGDLAQGGASVLSYQQNLEANELRKKLVEAQMKNGGQVSINMDGSRDVPSPIAPIPYGDKNYWFNQYRG